MKRTLGAVTLALALVGCRPVAPPPPVTDAQLVQLTVNGVGSRVMSATARILPSGSGLAAQEVGKLTFQPVSVGTFVVTGTRYIRASFLVGNLPAGTVAFAPVSLTDTDGNPANNAAAPTVSGTALSDVRLRDGTPAPDLASRLVFGQPQQFDAGAGTVTPFSGPNVSTYGRCVQFNTASLKVPGLTTGYPDGTTRGQTSTGGAFLVNVPVDAPAGGTRPLDLGLSFERRPDADHEPFSFTVVLAALQAAICPA